MEKNGQVEGETGNVETEEDKCYDHQLKLEELCSAVVKDNLCSVGTAGEEMCLPEPKETYWTVPMPSSSVLVYTSAGG